MAEILLEEDTNNVICGLTLTFRMPFSDLFSFGEGWDEVRQSVTPQITKWRRLL